MQTGQGPVLKCKGEETIEQGARRPVAEKETYFLAWVKVLASPHFSRTDFPALFPAESTPDFTFDEAKKFVRNE